MKLKNKLVIAATLMLVIVMTLSVIAVFIILNERNRNDAKIILNDSSALVNDAIMKKRQVLLSTSRQIAYTKNVFGMMIYLVRNRPYFDLILMKYMYRYLAETVLNISRTAGINETVIYDMQGNPVTFVKIKHGIMDIGYIHSYPNLIGEAATLVNGIKLTDHLWYPNEFPRKNLFDYHGPIPEEEEINIELIDSELHFVTLIPIKGQTYDTVTKTMVSEQLGFLKSTQIMDDALIKKIARPTNVQIDVITDPRRIQNILLKNTDLQVDGFKEQPGISFTKQLYHIKEGALTFKDHHQGILPVYSENKPLALIIHTFSKEKAVKQTLQIVKLLSIVFIIGILIIVPIAIQYANSITTPLSNVVKGLKSIALGNIHSLSVKAETKDEIGELVNGFNFFAVEIINSQNQLRQLSNNIIESQERERATIARGLHDELGQILTALRIDSVWLAEHLAQTDPKAASRSREMRDLIDRSIDEVRHIALKLRPRILDDLGLIAAIDWLVGDFEKRCGIQCEFDEAITEEIDNNTAIVIYRITQEALTNVGRHSKATKSRVTINTRLDMVYLIVSDNGQGFDPDILNTNTAIGLGISGIQERLMLRSGELDIHSEIGKGTNLFCTIPLFPNKNKKGDDLI